MKIMPINYIINLIYLGYGKALFPPNPDALLPDDKCCDKYPCYDNSPCPRSPIKDVKFKI